MSAHSIGKLNVVIGGDAGPLSRALSGASKSIVGFAAQAAAPLISLSGGLSAIAGIATGSMMAFAGPLGAIASAALPGGGLAALNMGLGHTAEAFDNAKDRARELIHESHKLGVSAKFLAGVELAAGPDADKVPGMMMKLEKTMAMLKSGGSDIHGKGGMLAQFVDVKELAQMEPEQQLRKIADAFAALSTHGDKAALAFAAFGRAGLDAMKMLEGGSGGIDKAIENEAKTLSSDPRFLGAMKQFKAEEKQFNQLKKRAENMAALLEMPNKQAELAWKEGNVGGWLGGKTKAWGGKVGRFFGMISDEQVLNNYRPLDEHKHARKTDPSFDPKTISEVISGMESEAAAAGKTADQFKRLQLEQAGATMAQLAHYDALSRTKEIRAANADIDAWNKSLATQINTFGMSANAAKEWELVMRGATPGKAAAARSSADWLDSLQDGKKIFDDVKTPLELYDEKLANLNKRFAQGVISQETYMRASQKLAAEIAKQEGTGAQAITVGSQEYYRALDEMAAMAAIANRPKPAAPNGGEQFGGFFATPDELRQLIAAQRATADAIKDTPIVRVIDIGQ